MEHLQTNQPKLSYEAWKKELKEITAKQTGQAISEIKINDGEAQEWWKDGFTPYATFRENYNCL